MGAVDMLVGPWGGLLFVVVVVAGAVVWRRRGADDTSVAAVGPDRTVDTADGLESVDLDALLTVTQDLVVREPHSPRAWMSHVDAALVAGQLDVATQALGLAHGDDDREALAQAKATAAYTLAVAGAPDQVARAGRLVSEAAEVLPADREVGAVLARLGDADGARPRLDSALSEAGRSAQRHPLHAFLALGELGGGSIGAAAADAGNMRAEGDWPGPLAHDVRLRLGAAVAVRLLESGDADDLDAELGSVSLRETAQWAVQGWLTPTDESPDRWRAFAAQGGSLQHLTPEAMTHVLAWSEAS